ncbi:unnamed protein product [Candida verbasci]|uniref:2',3'-cyclic-nucleotide 3'-phosphodiesterase n=1 Tax=Candida verbasci TaxID=1227364 RepID=A0A9W4TRF8_9ASCO|nr:unnamed protein product [Candida verbasci]
MGLGVALWLCPKRNTQIYDKINTLQCSLNTLFPDQPPRFEPHITITTNIIIDLDDPQITRDDVDRILSASVVAIRSLPKNHENLIKLSNIDSQRKLFKKLYFQVLRDPNLISFARIIRELFVIIPSDIEKENQKQNPHLYTQDVNGVTIKRKPSKKHKHKEEQLPIKKFDTSHIEAAAAYKAAEWSQQEYDPHLSLVYSNLWPIDNALWRTIKTRISDNLNVESCDDIINTGLGWDGGVLKLVLCEGDVNEWVTLGSVDI